MSEQTGEDCQHTDGVLVYLTEKTYKQCLVQDGGVIESSSSATIPTQDFMVYCQACEKSWNFATLEEAPVWAQVLYWKAKIWAYDLDPFR